MRARRIDWGAGEVHWGVEFEAHVMWVGLGKGELLDRFVELPVADGVCEIAGARIHVPDRDDLESFVTGLVDRGVVVADPDVLAALTDREPHWSERTMRRRFTTTTGIGRKRIEQVRRARHAFALLQSGVPAATAALDAGFADQAHMTRSLRVLAGRTPSQILAG